MATIINTVNSSTFSLNGISYNKIYQPIKQGAEGISLYNTYDTSFKLMSAVPFGELIIDGNTYLTQALAIEGLLSVVYTNVVSGGGGGEWGTIVGTLSSQTDLQAALDAKADSATVSSWSAITGKPTTIAGYGITDAFTQSDADALYLGKTATATNSSKLNGHSETSASTSSTIVARDSSGDINARLFRSEYDTTNPTVGFIMTQIDTATNNYIRPSTPAQFRAGVTDAYYLGKTATASNSQLLDGVNSTQFLRSDVNDTMSAQLTFTARPLFNGGTSGSTSPFYVDSNTLVSNLNADLLDGVQASQFLRSDATDTKTAGDLILNDSVQLELGTNSTTRTILTKLSGGDTLVDALQNDIRFRFQGNNRFTFDMSPGNLICVGNVTANSDRRLKENIETIPNALDKVDQLVGCTWNRIDNGNRQTGLIAQDLQKVLPEAVMVGKDEAETLSVAYGNVVGLLVEAIKDLRIEVEQLKNK